MVGCLPDSAGLSEPYRKRIELVQGTLAKLILGTLLGPQHGHGIGQALRTKSDNALQIEEGFLSPALDRLEKEGWLVAE